MSLLVDNPRSWREGIWILTRSESGHQGGFRDRQSWLRELRRMNALDASLVGPDPAQYDPYWSELEPIHRSFLERFLSGQPVGGRVLDAACGTGKYLPMVLSSGRSVAAVDHVEAYLGYIQARFPAVTTANHELQDLPYVDEFDGVMCVDAMEFIPPEDWPVVVGSFRSALHSEGRLYLTVELHHEEDVRAANEAARSLGFPVVAGEVYRGDPVPHYHFYPSMEQVYSWLAEAGFVIDESTEGPWHEDSWAYHHVLATRA